MHGLLCCYCTVKCVHATCLFRVSTKYMSKYAKNSIIIMKCDHNTVCFHCINCIINCNVWIIPHSYLFPYSVCRVRSEDHPRIAAPVVAIAIEKSSQLADSLVDSLVDSPIRIEFSVNQVCFSCQLFMHFIVRTVHIRCVQCMCQLGWMESFALIHHALCTIVYCQRRIRYICMYTYACCSTCVWRG